MPCQKILPERAPSNGCGSPCGCLAWISHCAGQGLIAYSLAHLPAAFSSVSLLFQPVMAAVFAWILLAEPLVPLQIVGGVIVLFGIYLARRDVS